MKEGVGIVQDTVGKYPNHRQTHLTAEVGNVPPNIYVKYNNYVRERDREKPHGKTYQ